MGDWLKRLVDLREKLSSVLLMILILPILSISLIDLYSHLKYLTTRSHQVVVPPNFQEHSLRFAVVGDTRSQLPLLGSSEVWPKLLASMQNYFINQEMTNLIHLGDLVKNGRDLSEWERLIKEMPHQIWAIQGNHDRGPYFKDLFRDQILDHLQINENTCLWGFNTEVDENLAMDAILELILNLDHPMQNRSQSQTEIDQQTQIDQIRCALSPIQIWTQHRPIYSTGPHGSDELGWNHWLIPMLHRIDIDLHLSGHDHFYERRIMDGILYVVSGGGTRFSAPLWWRPWEKGMIARGGWVHWIAFESRTVGEPCLNAKVIALEEDADDLVDAFDLNCHGNE